MAENKGRLTRSLSTSSAEMNSRSSSFEDDRSANEYIIRSDDDLVTAAEALTRLNSGIVTPPNSEVSEQSTLISRSTTNQSMDLYPAQHPLVTRVNQVKSHPIVTNAFRYYESSKQKYAPFNYAAGIVEAAAIPVVNKIEVNLNNRYIASQTSKEAEIPSEEGSHRQKKRRVGGGSGYNSSLEKKKKLQFCLHILKSANEQINSKVNTLQQKVEDTERTLKEQREDFSSAEQAELSPEDPKAVKEEKLSPSSSQAQCLVAQETGMEIVNTVKKIIRLISNFKPSSLTPENDSNSTSRDDSRSENTKFKSSIRDIILSLPNTIQPDQDANNQQTNDRIILFAKESLDMIGRLTNVFNDQLQKAEEWVAGSSLKELQIEDDHKIQNDPESPLESIETASEINDEL